MGGVCLVGCEEGFLEVGGNFFLSVLSASHPNTPNPSFSPKEGLSLVFFFIEGLAFRKQPWRRKVYEKEHKGKLTPPYGEG